MAAPLRERAAGPDGIALLQPLGDAGEVVAVLAEAHRHVEDRDVEEEPGDGAERVDEGVERPRDDRERNDREEPRNRALVRLAGVELPLEVSGIAYDRGE